MKPRKFRVYVDTSVIGGCLDEEFSQDSNRLLDAAKREMMLLTLRMRLLHGWTRLFLGTLSTLFVWIV